MDITLEVDDELVTRAKKIAAAKGKTLDQLVEDHLRKVLGDCDDEYAKENA